jgi:hypothetical protein
MVFKFIVIRIQSYDVGNLSAQGGGGVKKKIDLYAFFDNLLAIN